jgi:arylsulfatase A-like enzyme
MLVPQRWFDQHPQDRVQLPLIQKQDLDDLSEYARDLTTREHVAPQHEWIVRNQKWEHAVQSYLACSTFVDACVGKVLEALNDSPYRDNTLVVLFSDHGFHLGEKERWAKRSLWEDGTHVPMILAGAGLPSGQVCQQPAGLIDIYPTLLELCSMAPDKAHEGSSLKPQIDNPQSPRLQPAITTFGPGNHAVRSTDWRYIRYRDGSEELYDHRVDPHEWKNLANNGQWETVLARHRQYLPKQEHSVLGKNSTGHRAFAAAENALAERRRSTTVEPTTSRD